ncbi:hypothetical protein FV232_24510, partial [Methylobacterium sp. WL30]|uniref:hypothetical protein n=1 Tax=Methylobacterium sp. WL30 TaxID=2603895 RepID=UPI0011CCAA02
MAHSPKRTAVFALSSVARAALPAKLEDIVSWNTESSSYATLYGDRDTVFGSLDQRVEDARLTVKGLPDGRRLASTHHVVAMARAEAPLDCVDDGAWAGAASAGARQRWGTAVWLVTVRRIAGRLTIDVLLVPPDAGMHARWSFLTNSRPTKKTTSRAGKTSRSPPRAPSAPKAPTLVVVDLVA